MATNKDFSYNITTAVRSGYRFIKSIYAGKPSIFTSQDLNRHFSQIQTNQSEQGSAILPKLENVSFVSQGSTYKIEPTNVNVPMYVFYMGARFTIPNYEFSAGDSNPSESYGVYVIATKDIVTYAEDPELSGIEVSTVPYSSASSNTEVYVDERIVYGDVNNIALNVNEEIICKIGYLQKTKSFNTSYDVANTFTDSQEIAKLIPTGISLTELENINSNQSGGILDYVRSLRYEIIQRLTAIITDYSNKDDAINDRIDELDDRITGDAENIAFLDQDNPMQRATYSLLNTTSNYVTVEDDLFLSPSSQAPTNYPAIFVDNLQTGDFNTLKTSVLTSLRVAGAPPFNGYSESNTYILFALGVTDTSKLKNGYTLKFRVEEQTAFYIAGYVASVTETRSYPIKYSGSALQQFSGYGEDIFILPKNGIMSFVFYGNEFHLLEFTNNHKAELGYQNSRSMWRSKSPSDMMPGLGTTNTLSLVDTVFRIQQYNRQILDDFSKTHIIQDGSVVIEDLTADGQKSVFASSSPVTNDTILTGMLSRGEVTVTITLDRIACRGRGNGDNETALYVYLIPYNSQGNQGSSILLGDFVLSGKDQSLTLTENLTSGSTAINVIDGINADFSSGYNILYSAESSSDERDNFIRIVGNISFMFKQNFNDTYTVQQL